LTALVGLALVAACGYADVPNNDTSPVSTTVKTAPSAAPGADDFNEGSGKTPVKFPDGLQYIDLQVGSGTAARTNDQVSMQYTGWLIDGKKFDSSRDRGQAFDFTLGKGEVIKGWDEGVPGMKPGGRRKLTIPYPLAYLEQGKPPTIPPKATLVFIVELVSVTPASASPSPSPSPS
jgi:FKBP-type peptidyl-prolyl cis-trans isomerase